jgi:hypothetical protein
VPQTFPDDSAKTIARTDEPDEAFGAGRIDLRQLQMPDLHEREEIRGLALGPQHVAGLELTRLGAGEQVALFTLREA